MSFPARFVAAFMSPSELFQELVHRPTWLAPLLAITLAVCAQQAVIWFSPTGLAAMRLEFQEKMPANAPPDALDKQLAITKYVAPVMATIFTPVILLLFAGLVYLLFSIVMGGEGTFKQTFSCYCHIGLIGILQAVVGTAMVFLKGNMKSSTAVSAFLPFLEEKSFAYRFSQGLDVFFFWQFGVLAIGMAILNKISTGKAATVIFSVYLGFWLVFCIIWQALS
jgi:hypothetical protein